MVKGKRKKSEVSGDSQLYDDTSELADGLVRMGTFASTLGVGMSQVGNNAAGFLRGGLKSASPENNLLLSETFDEINIMKRASFDLTRKNRTLDPDKDRSYRVKVIKSFTDINPAHLDQKSVMNGNFFSTHSGGHKKGSKSLNFAGHGTEISRQSS